MSFLNAEQTKLLDRIEGGEEENRQLKEILAPDDYTFPSDWKLTKTEAGILSFLASREKVTWEQIHRHCEHISDKREPLSENIAQVWKCKIQKKILATGWVISANWGVGCYLENREEFNKLYRRQDDASR